jgi:hypothetical protein
MAKTLAAVPALPHIERTFTSALRISLVQLGSDDRPMAERRPTTVVPLSAPGVRLRRFVPDSPLEQGRFELPVPPARDVKNRLPPCRSPNAATFCDPGPGVRIHLPPAESRVRTRLTEGKGGADKAARVLAIRTMSGAASACRRAARFGASPTTSCSGEAPARSPTTTRARD